MHIKYVNPLGAVRWFETKIAFDSTAAQEGGGLLLAAWS